MSAWKEYKEKSLKLSQERMPICESCLELFEPTKTCKKCGCFVVLKTKIVGEKCPLNKW